MVGEPRAASLNVSLFSASTIPEMSMQEHLKSLMQFVRLATFSHDEIMKEVMTTKILTPTEGMELLTAISNKQLWEVPGFCKTQELRELSKKSSTCIDAKNLVESKSGKICVFSSCMFYGEEYHELSDREQTSVVSVNTKKAIVIKELGFMSRPIAKGDKQPVYKFSCAITVRKIEGVVTDVQFIKIEGQIPYEEEILFPLNLGSGAPVRLEADSSYLFTLEFSPPHPIYRLSYQSGNGMLSHTTMNEERPSGDDMTIKFKTPLHIRKITYNVE